MKRDLLSLAFVFLIKDLLCDPVELIALSNFSRHTSRVLIR